MPPARNTPQKAFIDALNDPKLQAEAKKQALAITPLAGPDVAAMVKEVARSPTQAT